MAERVGLKVPDLPRRIQTQLREYTPLAGTSVRNPLDTVGIGPGGQFLKTVCLVAGASNIHTLVMQSRIDWSPNQGQDTAEFIRQSVDMLKESREAADKPIACVVWPPRSLETMSKVLDFQRGVADAGLPVYWGMERALRSISKFLDWRENS